MDARSWLHRLLVRVPPPETSAPPPQEPAAGRRGPAPSPTQPPDRRLVTWLAFEPRAFHRSVVFVLVAVSIWFVALWAFHATAHFLFLLLLAWLIAIAMEPVIRWLVRHRLPRLLAAGVTGCAGLVIVLGVGALFGTTLAEQISQLAIQWPQMVSGIVSWANGTFHLSLDPTRIASAIDLTRLADYGSAVAQGAFGILGTLGSITFDVLTVVVFAFYLAASGPGLLQHVASWLPPDKQEIFATVWETSTAKTGAYVVSKFILIALSTFFHAIFFYVLGLPGWLPLALLTGVTSQLVPLIGTYIGIIAAVLVALFVDPLDAVWVVVFATVYQQVENYVFTPRVSNRTMDVSAPIALAAVFVGVALWGPIGALIGIPLAAAVVSLLETYGHRYELVAQIAEVGVASPRRHADLGTGAARARDDGREVAPSEGDGGTAAPSDGEHGRAAGSSEEDDGREGPPPAG
ncbi:AI-2E family transporter [Intrasporangium sp.]|uniref:AI-2E family transporter n=1 Tax=Intrasporangium sp. TaxID=1925024 RepID=UPI003221FC87